MELFHIHTHLETALRQAEACLRAAEEKVPVAKRIEYADKMLQLRVWAEYLRQQRATLKEG